MLRIVPSHTGTYDTGSAVRGDAVLDVSEPKSYKQISVRFVGKTRVSWELSAFDMSTIRTKISDEEYFVNDAAILWSKEQSLDGKLAPGQYRWPFSFHIPHDAPPTFEGKSGNISYSLVATIKTGRIRHDRHVKLSIPVKQVVIISDPHLFQPRCKEVQKRVCCCCCASGAVVLNVTVPKTGFCIGKKLTLHASIENGSNQRLKLKAFINKQTLYSAKGRHRRHESVIVIRNSDQIAARSTQEWDPSITIPETDIVHCRFIKMSFTLTVSAIFTAASALTLSMPITLGTKQQRQQQLVYAPQSQHGMEFSTHSQLMPPPSTPYPAELGPHGAAPGHQFGDVINPHPQYQYGRTYPPSGQRADPPPEYQYEPPPLPNAPTYPPHGLVTHVASVTMEEKGYQ